MWRAPVICAAALLCLGGCSGNATRSCEDSRLYSSSATIGPLRVPDDLAVPDESETLLIPDVTSAAEENAAAMEGCVEAPPPFLQGQQNNSG